MGDENHDQNKHSNNKHENGTIMLATHGSSNHGDAVRRIHSNEGELYCPLYPTSPRNSFLCIDRVEDALVSQLRIRDQA